jgi:uncharacterized protein YjbI with pentapeptide repeats
MIQDAAPPLHQVEMKRRKEKLEHRIDPPDLPKDGLETLGTDRIDSTEYQLVVIEGAKLCDASMSGLRFDSCILRRLEFDRSKLPNFKLVDVRIEKSSFVNGQWASPSLRRVEITAARMTGLSIVEGEFSDVMFKDCKLDYLRLADARLNNVRFEGCALSDADFNKSRLENIGFSGCDLRNADLTHARLENVDLSGSKIEGLKIDPPQLKALTIDPAQAMAIVQMLGAKIV